MNYWWILLPLISALIGWAVAWIAGKLLVRRIIPARKELLKEAVVEFVLSAGLAEHVRDKLAQPATIQSIMPKVEGYVDDFLRNKLKTKMPMIGMLIGDKTTQTLRTIFLQEIEEVLPGVLREFAVQMISEGQLTELIDRQVNQLDPGRIESSLAPLLAYYNRTAAIGGFLVGIVDLLLVFSMF